jgi:hypothetical protein
MVLSVCSLVFKDLLTNSNRKYLKDIYVMLNEQNTIQNLYIGDNLPR